MNLLDDSESHILDRRDLEGTGGEDGVGRSESEEDNPKPVVASGGGDRQEMTAVVPDALPPPPPARQWLEFKWEHFGEDNGGLTDNNTITSAASAKTWKQGKGWELEEHELGPKPKKNPGPPFAVGDVIMCNICGTAGLQQAFVLSADHPKYHLCLEEGRTVGTHVGEAWMSPRWVPGEFVEDQDDPFARVWTNYKLKMGSYGIQVDLQLESLQKIKEAKEFAKAVKADNAEIPVYLWNDRIRSPGIIREERDAALTRFRKLGHQVFMRGLVCDCTEYMQRTYGPTWGPMPRRRDGTPTGLG